MLYLAIDQHAKHLTVNLRDEGGDVLLRRQVSTRPERVRVFFKRLRNDAAEHGGYVAILEVCGFNDWLLDLLNEYGCREIVLMQPRQKSKRKTDRRDANALGELLWVNRQRLLSGRRIQGLRRVHIPSRQDGEDRRLTARRQRVGRDLTRAINRVKHILRRHNRQHDCPTKGIQTQTARRWLGTLALPTVDRLELDQLLACWDLALKQRAVLEQCLAERVRACLDQARTSAVAHPVLMTLTLPGAGPYTALALACRIGPIERFERPGSLANFWGLAPSVNDSGEATGRVGSITKQGSAMARFLLGQMVLHVLRKDARMRSWHRQIKSRRGSKTARVAVMRRITTILWHMLQTGEIYRLEPPARPARQPRRRGTARRGQRLTCAPR